MGDAATTEDDRDVVVIGGGPAGLSAALVLGRARRSVLVADTGRPRDVCSPATHGFLTRDGSTPAEFLEIAHREVRAYGVETTADPITAVVPDNGAQDAGAAGMSAAEPAFRVTLASGRTVTARRVVAASGITDELPTIDGLADRWGRDALHCPYCHGYEVRDRPLAVIAGDAEGAVHQALLLRQWSHDIVVLLHEVDPAGLSNDDRKLLAACDVPVVTGLVASVMVADDRLTGVRLVSGDVLERAAVFVSPRFRLDLGPLTDLAPRTTDSDMGVYVATDPEGRTSVPGFWAVGNLADLSAQMLGAAELGARAAVGINGELALTDAQALAVQVERRGAGAPHQ